MIKKAQQMMTQLGLKENEAIVYLCCLKVPSGLFVYQIVEHTELKRSTIDLVLQRLRRRQLITRHKEGARWVYVAEQPQKLAFDFEERLKDFRSFIPSLLQTLAGAGVVKVQHYRGVGGIEAVFDDILLSLQSAAVSERELLSISSGTDLFEVLPDHNKKFVTKRIRRGVPLKIIAPSNQRNSNLFVSSKKHLREAKFFDENRYPFSIELDIYRDKLALFDFNRSNLVATVITSRSISNSMRSLFEMLWMGALSAA